MKDKNLPEDNNSKTIDDLRKDINRIIDDLEKKKDLQGSIESYQKLIKLNDIIGKKFQKKSKEISKKTNEKIKNINSKKR
tara:strand:- start:460 stop:699 length:240 start_codon:yes stop_codon:yes gene_type:complete